jgi:hypothetical protein
MNDNQQQQQQQQDGGRGGDPNRLGGASQDGHLSPQIDQKDGKSETGGQIAQDRQQASGQGSGQS